MDQTSFIGTPDSSRPRNDMAPGPAPERGTDSERLAHSASPLATPAPGASPLRILLVEDAEDTREVIAMFLEGGRYQIDPAENGAVGVERFRDGHYDLVLMDLLMPIMDGYQATVAIRQWERERGHPATPIIALTANAFPEDVDLALGAGCTAHMAKPVRKAALIKAISEYTTPESNQAA